MNGLARLASLPDELSNGYMGRLARTNGFDSISKFDQFLDAHVRRSRTRNGFNISRVELLSEIAGISLHSFVTAHSMLSLWQGVVGTPGSPDSQRDFYHALQAYGTRASRAALYYCPECAKADVAFHGMSYWRREHQLAGVYGCTKHERPLAYVPQTSVITAPARIGDRGVLCSELFELSATSEPIQRASELAHALLQTNTRRSTEQVFQVLRPHLRSVGIGGYTYLDAKSSLFELICDAYPSDWIRASFADDQLLAPDQLFRHVNGVFVPVARPSTFWVLLLSTTAVAKSCDEAMTMWSLSELPAVAVNAQVVVQQVCPSGELLDAVR